MKKVFTFILGLIICSTLVVFADNMINANQVKYNNNSLDTVLNDLYDRTLNGIGTESIIVDENESNIFSSLTVEAIEEKSDIVVTIKPVFKSNHDENDILEYILVVDGVAYGSTTTTSIKIKDYTLLTEYRIKAIAVDKNIKLHVGTLLTHETPNITYVREVLEYPIITADGIKNIKYAASPNSDLSYYELDITVQPTAAKALPVEAYDGNSATVAGPYNTTFKYLNIDPSAYGKKLKVTTNSKYQCYYFGYTTSNSTACSSSNVSGRAASYTLTIPSNKTQLTLYSNEGLSYKEMTVE